MLNLSRLSSVLCTGSVQPLRLAGIFNTDRQSALRFGDVANESSPNLSLEDVLIFGVLSQIQAFLDDIDFARPNLKEQVNNLSALLPGIVNQGLPSQRHCMTLVGKAGRFGNQATVIRSARVEAVQWTLVPDSRCKTSNGGSRPAKERSQRSRSGDPTIGSRPPAGASPTAECES
jgi:hypothetical protein